MGGGGSLKKPFFKASLKKGKTASEKQFTKKITNVNFFQAAFTKTVRKQLKYFLITNALNL